MEGGRKPLSVLGAQSDRRAYRTRVALPVPRLLDDGAPFDAFPERFRLKSMCSTSRCSSGSMELERPLLDEIEVPGGHTTPHLSLAVRIRLAKDSLIAALGTGSTRWDSYGVHRVQQPRL